MSGHFPKNDYHARAHVVLLRLARIDSPMCAFVTVFVDFGAWFYQNPLCSEAQAGMNRLLPQGHTKETVTFLGANCSRIPQLKFRSGGCP